MLEWWERRKRRKRMKRKKGKKILIQWNLGGQMLFCSASLVLGLVPFFDEYSEIFVQLGQIS